MGIAAPVTTVPREQPLRLAASAGADCNNNGTLDLQEPSWTNRDDDGDGFCNGADYCPYEFSTVNDASACPVEAITVPADPADPSATHATYSGATVTLKGIARYGATQFVWDYGDGSRPMPWTAISNPYNLGVTHVYTGAVGQAFTATLSVAGGAVGSPTDVATATYPVEIEQASDLSDPAQMDVRAAMAVENGLWYLHTQESRGSYADGSPGFREPYGYWNASGQDRNVSCVAVDAFETHGSLPSGSYDTDPYVEDVQRGLTHVLVNTNSVPIGTQTYGDGVTLDPDVNGNGFGLTLGAGNDIGAAATCLTALSDARSPGRVANVGGASVEGRSYADLAQDAVDYFAYAQNDTGAYEGGWGYSSNDNTITDPGFEFLPYQAIASAEAETGATVPPAVRREMPRYLNVQHRTAPDTYNGGWGYNGGSDTFYMGVASTASGLVAEDLLGNPATNPDVAAGVGFIYRHWMENDGAWHVNLGVSNTMYAVATALRAATPPLAQVRDWNYAQGGGYGGSLDWYYTPSGQTQHGYATDLVSRQGADGSWVDTPNVIASGQLLATALDTMVLSKTTPGMASNHAPVWFAPTPLAGTVIDATPGEPVSIDVTATDPDAGDVATLTASTAPADATFSTTSGNTATGTLTWTPAAVGSTDIEFSATDTRGLVTTRLVTIVATKKSPTIVWAAPSSVAYGTPLDGTQLDATLSDAVGANVPPHPGSFSYLPSTGAVLDGGDNTLLVTWTPSSDDAAGWNAVTATVTLHVNQAAQTLSFAPPIDDSTTHTYGDPPFTVTAVSDAGLPVTYSVGAGDTCTSTPQADGSTQITITGAGSCTLSVDQPGNLDYAPAAMLTHSFDVARHKPTVDLAPQDTTYGVPLGAEQLDATVTPSDASLNGAISYTIDGHALPADDVVPAGSHSLTAVYTPDATTGGDNYTTASATATFNVAKASQTIHFASLANKTFDDAAFDVAATATSGLPVTFSSNTSDVCVVTSTGSVSVLHAGTCTVAADQVGDDNYDPASTVTQSFTIGQASQAIDFTSPGDQTYLDGPVALTAAGGGSGNPVTFAAGPDSICGADGGNLLLFHAGQCSITASQAGNADYAAAPDVSHTITINKATPTITWGTPHAISYGTALGAAQLNASVAPAMQGTFSYTLADGTTTADGALLPASDTPRALNVTFTPAAPYDADFSSASGSTTVVVNKADQVISWMDVPTTKTYGDGPFTVSAAGGGSGKPVAFSAEAGSSCTVSGSTVTITAAGPCVLDADQAGDGNYNAATASTRSVTVDKQTPAINWSPPANVVYGTALGAGELDATVAPDEAGTNGTVSYSTDAAPGDAAGQVLHAGRHTLTANYTPASSGPGLDYTGAIKTVELTVDQAPQVITGFDPISTKTFGDGPLTLGAVGGASRQPVFFTATGSCVTSNTNGTSLTLTGAGTCIVTAHEDGTTDFSAAPDMPQEFQIQQAPQTITFAPLPDAHVGDPTIPLSATGGRSGNPMTFTAGPAATCTTTAGGALTITGPGTCTVTASQAGNSNYLDAVPVSHAFAVAYRICSLTAAGQTHPVGSVVQVRVTICDAAGHSLASAGVVLHAVAVDNAAAHAPGNSQPDNNFRYTGASGGSYQYNLDTSGLAAGTHQLFFTVLDDPMRHSLTITLG